MTIKKPATEAFSLRLLTWFDQHGRKNLPWQSPLDPYRVWVSEIMLQQTQVETVIPYFLRFMERFPKVQALANAPQDDVLHLWTGLGYYARARNLHRCAKTVADAYQGVFPDTLEALTDLPGIGPSTAAAIASIAFGKPTAILDGNVKRVLARHQAIDGWPGEKKVHEQLWRIAERYMPTERCRDYTQAIMDLGATLCTRSNPRCNDCPVQKDCLALATDRVNDLPAKKPKKTKPVKQRYFLMFQHKETIFLEQRPEKGIWGGLWCFPEVDYADDLTTALKAYKTPHQTPQTWTGWRHTFTHYHLDIHPVLVQVKSLELEPVNDLKTHWYNLEKPDNLGLAAPVKKLLSELSVSKTHQESLAL